MNRMPLGLALCAFLALAPASYALTSGPAMPEYNDFESVENTDLVNLTTGDFSYSIPLMDVPGPGIGFPLVLNYHAGIMPEQEASWVGLGWNLQGGAITRRINKVPDDFNGQLIREEIDSKHLHGWMASIGWNGATVGVSWDNENGLGGMVGYSYGPAMSGPIKLGVGVTAGFNGVYEGVGVTLSVSAGQEMGDARASVGVSIGIHSERGVTAGLSGGISMASPGGANKQAQSTSVSLANIGVSLSSKSGLNGGASLGVGGSMSSTVTANMTQSSMGLWLPTWTPWTGYIEVNWGSWDVYIEGLQEDRYYGFLYSNDQDMGCNVSNPETCYKTTEVIKGVNITRVRKMEFNNSMASLREDNSAPRFGNTAEDMYSVQTQGISGVFRPFRTEDGDYYTFLSKDYKKDDGYCESIFGDWFGAKCPREGTLEFTPYYEANRNRHSNSSYSPHDKIVWRFNSEAAGGLYSQPATRDGGAEVSAASSRIEPLFKQGLIAGWRLTKENGVQYLYTLAQYNLATLNISSADPLLTNPTRQKMPNYAYAWLMTAMLSTDYVAVGARTTCETYDGAVSICLPQQGDVGGWVRLNYTTPKTFFWNSNAEAPSTGSPSSYVFNGTGGLKGSSYAVSKGVKTISYLSSIETPTHEAIFILGDGKRKDGLPIATSELGLALEKEDLGTSSTAMPACQDPATSLWPAYVLSELSWLRGFFPVTTTIVPGGSSVTGKGFRLKDIDLPDNTIIHAQGYTQQAYLYSRWRQKKFLGIPVGIDYKVSCEVNYLPQDLGRFKVLSGVAHRIDASDNPIPPSADIIELGDLRSVHASLDVIPNGTPGLSFLQGIALMNKSQVAQGYTQPESTQSAAVNFEYDYTLSPGTPNSGSTLADDGGTKGKLTLRTVRMGASTKGPWQAPYVFRYSNAAYTSTPDKWGYRCETCVAGEPDGKADKWNLDTIETPAGQTMTVKYEPKQVDFVGKVPVVLGPNADLSQYFDISSGPVTFDWAKADGPEKQPSPFAGNVDPISSLKHMAQEIKQELDPKYKVLVSNYDLYDGDDGAVFLKGIAPANLYGGVNPDYFLVEAADIYVEDPVIGRIFKANMTGIPGNVTRIASSRLSSGSDTKTYYVGFKTTTTPAVLPNVKMGRHYGLVKFFFSKLHSTTPLSVRVWAVYNSNPLPNFVHYGGGVRAKSVTFRDLDGQTNVAEYAYQEAATPSLPSSLGAHKNDYLYPARLGYNSFIGNPAILHGQVGVTFRDGADATPITNLPSTRYHFVTSKDLPIAFAFSDEDPATKLSKIKVYDRSGIWGSLWKKEEREGDGGPVKKSEQTQWSNHLKMFMSEPLLNETLVRDGKPLLAKEDLDVFFNVSVHGKAPNKASNSDYFGVEQKLFSHRYVKPECGRVDEEDQDNCLENVGVTSTQMEVLRFSHFLRKQTTEMDGLSQIKEKNYFDFLTGTPLVDYERRDATHYLTTLKRLAYHNAGNLSPSEPYTKMLDRNMLTQEFSTTVFDFDKDPATVDFGALTPAERSSVVTSSFASWEDVPVAGTAGSAVRQSESFKLKDIAAFALPDRFTAASPGPKWLTQGRNTRYDAFGHPIEFKNALGHFATQVYGYRQSLPVAFIQNAKRNDVFYESFEDEGSTGHRVEGRNSKTGDRSLRVQNCLETTAQGGALAKPGCSVPPISGITCFDLGTLDKAQKYQAEVWYFDEHKGSDPADPTLENRTYHATRPGIFLGSLSNQCVAETHPNGAIIDPAGPVVQPPAPPTRADYKSRSTGSRTWKRLFVDLDPSSLCPSATSLSQSMVCVYASKGKAGSDVVYDELRVHPQKSLMTTYTYDHGGKMTTSADANGVVKRFDYDKFGNLKGVRNDEGILLSEQAKKYRQPDIGVLFKDRDPVSFDQPLCLIPTILRNGHEVTSPYKITSSSDPLVAQANDDGQKLCTYDYSGTSDISVYFEELGRTLVAPIRVTGNQVGMLASGCETVDSKIKDADNLDDSEVRANKNAKKHCQLDFSSLTQRVEQRLGRTPSGYGITIELLDFNTNTTDLQFDPWLCLDGADEGFMDCNFPQHHAHLRFSNFIRSDFATNPQPSDHGVNRPILQTSFPDIQTASRFKTFYTGNIGKYIVISNNASRYSDAPMAFKKNGSALQPILFRNDLNTGNNYVKIELGIDASYLNSRPVAEKFQFDFSMNAQTLSGGSVSGPAIYRRKLTSEDGNLVDNVKVTFRAYESTWPHE